MRAMVFQLPFPSWRMTLVRLGTTCEIYPHVCNGREGWNIYRAYIPRWQPADLTMHPANGNKSHSAWACSCTTGAFHGDVQEIPAESKQTGGGPAFVRHLRDFERDAVLFIGTFAAAHGEARAESRVFPCAWVARSRVNYLDKSPWPPVCARLWRFYEARNSATVFRYEGRRVRNMRSSTLDNVVQQFISLLT